MSAQTDKELRTTLSVTVSDTARVPHLSISHIRSSNLATVGSKLLATCQLVWGTQQAVASGGLKSLNQNRQITVELLSCVQRIKVHQSTCSPRMLRPLAQWSEAHGVTSFQKKSVALTDEGCRNGKAAQPDPSVLDPQCRSTAAHIIQLVITTSEN